MKILAISTGTVGPISTNAKDGSPVLSAIHKFPISTIDNPKQVFASTLGLEADAQENLKVHGGINKAIYAYPYEHYAFWQEIFLREKIIQNPSNALNFGLVGENLTIVGLLEEQVYIGDQWRIGEVELMVTEFREPCFKLNIKLNYKGAAKVMLQSTRSGWYLKVLKEGNIFAGSEIEVHSGPKEISIASQSKNLWKKSGQTNFEF